ncbi:MAG: hypothetical protein KAS32_03585 [Candidatus Peribacteraceae bacterium]|nr:hypothetical protein [Candidatus Peribacteraceae bacterium]
MAQRVPGAMQDLFTALGVFRQGMDRLATTRALTNANEQVEQIRTQELGEADQRQQIRQVANNLTVKMLGAGASLGQIQAAGSAFAPPEPSALEQKKELIQEQQKGAVALEQLRQTGREELTGIAAGAAEKKAEKQQEREELGRMVPGFGLANTKEDASKLKTLIGDLKPAGQGMDRLLELAKTPFSKLSIKARAEARALAGALRGQLRLAIIGPGAMSDQERAVLNEIVSNPTEFFEIPAAAIASLNALKGAMGRKLQAELDVRGVTQNLTVDTSAPINIPQVPVDKQQNARRFLKFGQ